LTPWRRKHAAMRAILASSASRSTISAGVSSAVFSRASRAASILTPLSILSPGDCVLGMMMTLARRDHKRIVARALHGGSASSPLILPAGRANVTPHGGHDAG